MLLAQEQRESESKLREMLGHIDKLNLNLQMAVAAKSSSDDKNNTLTEQKKVLVKEVKTMRKKAEQSVDTIAQLKSMNDRLTQAVHALQEQNKALLSRPSPSPSSSVTPTTTLTTASVEATTSCITIEHFRPVSPVGSSVPENDTEHDTENDTRLHVTSDQLILLESDADVLKFASDAVAAYEAVDRDDAGSPHAEVTIGISQHSPAFNLTNEEEDGIGDHGDASRDRLASDEDEDTGRPSWEIPVSSLHELGWLSNEQRQAIAHRAGIAEVISRYDHDSKKKMEMQTTTDSNHSSSGGGIITSLASSLFYSSSNGDSHSHISPTTATSTPIAPSNPRRSSYFADLTSSISLSTTLGSSTNASSPDRHGSSQDSSSIADHSTVPSGSSGNKRASFLGSMFQIDKKSLTPALSVEESAQHGSNIKSNAGGIDFFDTPLPATEPESVVPDNKIRCLRCGGTVEGPKYSTCKCLTPALTPEDISRPAAGAVATGSSASMFSMFSLGNNSSSSTSSGGHLSSPSSLPSSSLGGMSFSSGLSSSNNAAQHESAHGTTNSELHLGSVNVTAFTAALFGSSNNTHEKGNAHSTATSGSNSSPATASSTIPAAGTRRSSAFAGLASSFLFSNPSEVDQTTTTNPATVIKSNHPGMSTTSIASTISNSSPLLDFDEPDEQNSTLGTNVV